MNFLILGRLTTATHTYIICCAMYFPSICYAPIPSLFFNMAIFVLDKNKVAARKGQSVTINGLLDKWKTSKLSICCLLKVFWQLIEIEWFENRFPLTFFIYTLEPFRCESPESFDIRESNKCELFTR